MKRKECEDYEPISNIGVCSALLIVLGTATYMGVFSEAKESVEKENNSTIKVVQKADQKNIKDSRRYRLLGKQV